LSAHTPRKRFGQHFLADRGVIDAIVDAIAPLPGQALVEIGPGLGALTAALLPRCGRLTVIELDRDLASRLRRRDGLDVIEADVLRVDFRALAAERFPGQALRVVGNLPYNISSPILFHLLPLADVVADQHFMLQKEVVDRMAAGPGGRDYGRLSVMLQWRYRITPLLEVPPEAFDPPPRVDSAVVRMVPLGAQEMAAAGTAAPGFARTLGALVAVAFSQRRKLLRHALGPWIERHAPAARFDLQRRAEEVPVAEYLALAAAAAPGADDASA
jgi:16S rRNA (adenine1518-N6/adenine1519-N6)-dimethyltransferase